MHKTFKHASLNHAPPKLALAQPGDTVVFGCRAHKVRRNTPEHEWTGDNTHTSRVLELDNGTALFLDSSGQAKGWTLCPS